MTEHTNREELERLAETFIDSISVLRPYTRVTKEAKRQLLALFDQQIGKYAHEEILRAQLAVASNAKIFTNKHGATYIVFEAEDRDISQNEIVAIFHSEINKLNRTDTTLRAQLSTQKKGDSDE